MLTVVHNLKATGKDGMGKTTGMGKTDEIDLDPLGIEAVHRHGKDDRHD
jgi:hypothetical protein